MAKLLVPHVKIEYAGVNFDIQLKSSIVAIKGDSGTGKSFLGRALVATDNNSPLRYVYLDWRAESYFDVVISGCKGKIIVIDNADILLLPTPKYKHIFVNDKYNQYIIMSRSGTSYGATEESIGELYRSDKHNIKMEYPYEIIKSHLI